MISRRSKQKMLIVTALLFGSCQALRMMNHVGSLEQGGQESLSYEVVQIAGQGMGTRAIRDIKYGETIFEERPVLTIENTDFVDYETATESELAHANNILQNQYDNLSTEDQNIIDEMYDQHQKDQESQKTLFGIFDSNCSSGSEVLALFRQYSFLNHSCRNNCEAGNNRGTVRVYARRDIKAGEQLTTRYLSFAHFPIYEERRKELKDVWEFDCACELCSASIEERQASDARRERFTTLSNELEAATLQLQSTEQVEAALKIVLEILDFLQQEYAPHGLTEENGHYAHLACQYSTALGDTENAAKFNQISRQNYFLVYNL